MERVWVNCWLRVSTEVPVAPDGCVLDAMVDGGVDVWVVADVVSVVADAPGAVDGVVVVVGVDAFEEADDVGAGVGFDPVVFVEAAGGSVVDGVPAVLSAVGFEVGVGVDVIGTWAPVEPSELVVAGKVFERVVEPRGLTSDDAPANEPAAGRVAVS